MIIALLLLIGVTAVSVSEPVPADKTTKEIHREGIGHQK